MRVLKVKDKISALLDKLHEVATKAEAEGKSAPNYDLCSITLDGASVFCPNNLGIPRKEMPQLKGVPVSGGWADQNLDKDESGEVNAESAFRKLLVGRGIGLNRSKMPASMLKATQNQLTGAKVAGMLDSLKNDPTDAGITAPIFVSKDGYILDGHHRWAALVGLDAHPEHNGVWMNADIVDLGIDDLLELALRFCSAIGIKNEEAAKLKILATVDNSKNHNLKSLKEVKEYFSKGDKLKIINIKDSSNKKSKFKIGDTLEITTITLSGVWAYHNRLKFEYVMSAPDMLHEYTNTDNNNFTYSEHGGSSITFTKSK